MSSPLINIRGLIAVQNHGGSGTLLFQSLLDEHPEIISLPALYGRELIQFWFDTKITNIEQFVFAFINHPCNLYWFDPNPQRYLVLNQHGLCNLGENRNENIAVDRMIFAANLMLELGRDELNLKNFITSVYLAYAKTRGIKHKDDCWLLFPFHQNPPQYAKVLAKSFPAIKFIHMVREPIQCLASGIRFESTQENGRMNPHWAAWIVNPNPGATPLLKADNVETCALRLEDLHTQGEKTLRALCRWLNIEWNPVLLQSTFNGKKWWNRPELKPINGLDKSFVRFRGQDIIPWFDRVRLEFLFQNWKKAWNYKHPSYVNNWFIEKLMRVLILFPFKIDYMPLKFSSSIKKMSYSKLFWMPPLPKIIKQKEQTIAMRVHVPQKDPITQQITVREFTLVDPPQEKPRKIPFLLWPAYNVVRILKNIRALYPIQYNYLNLAWKQRKIDNDLVKLLPLEDNL
ncbi:MAG: sulfotransferase [Gammaproteobacteria bacterium]